MQYACRNMTALGPRRPGRPRSESATSAVLDAAYRLSAALGLRGTSMQAIATEANLDDQTRLTSAFIEALSDARVTNEAARRHVAAQLNARSLLRAGLHAGSGPDRGAFLHTRIARRLR